MVPHMRVIAQMLASKKHIGNEKPERRQAKIKQVPGFVHIAARLLLVPSMGVIVQKHTRKPHTGTVKPGDLQNQREKIMELKQEQFKQTLQVLPERGRNKVQAVVNFLAWRNAGGPKNAEICHSEKLYKAFAQTK